MTEHIDSYYAASLSNPQSYNPLQETREADACIIGGGLAGLATALSLAEYGKKVILLEGRRVGYGASGRNGGFVLAGYAAGFKDIARKTGVDKAKTMFGFTRDAQKTIRQRIKDYEIDCNPVDGQLVASWYDNPDTMRGQARFMHEELDVPTEFLSRAEIRRHCHTEHYYDGVLYPDYFHIHPLNYIQGLAKALTDKGGEIFENTMALSVTSKANDHIIQTPQGQIKARHIVYCGSAYTNNIKPKLRRSCLPVSTYVMVTAPLTKKQRDSAFTLPYAIRDNRWCDDYYRWLPDGRLLWGGRVGLNKDTPVNLDDLMMADLLKIYPQLEGIKATYSWAGLMGYTVHKMPHIGQFKPGQWYCTNFGGNGVGPTTAGGELIASAIAENDKRYEMFKPFGFAYTGGILGPYVAQGVYHSWTMRDKLKAFCG